MVAFLLSAWKDTNEVGLPLWHFVRKDRQNMNPLLQEKIKNDFSFERCHWNIFNSKKESICRNMSIPIHFSSCTSPFVFFCSFQCWAGIRKKCDNPIGFQAGSQFETFKVSEME
jgi:hypothetical protein